MDSPIDKSGQVRAPRPFAWAAFALQSARIVELQWVRLAASVALIALWSHFLWYMYSTYGLFLRLGIDYAMYFVQASAFWAIDPAAIYQQQALDDYGNSISASYGVPLAHAGVAYPPIFPWLFTPFTWLSPATGFTLWTGLNFLAALYLACRVAQRFPTKDRWWVGVLVLTSFPVVTALAGGQVQLLLVCAFTECYLSLRAGRDFRGGLWLACLFFKPQYGILLGPVLLWKRRWTASAGAMLGILAILATSMLVAGLPAFLAYPSTLLVQGDFSGAAEPLTAPYLMTNGRGLTLRLFPRLADEPRMLMTLVLSAVIVTGVVLAWRGRWAPREARFPAQMTVLVLATVLANFHSHAYGPALLAMPLAELWREWHPSRLTRLAIAAAIILPTLILTFLSFENLNRTTLVFTLLLLVCYASVLVELLRRGQPRADQRQPSFGEQAVHTLRAYPSVPPPLDNYG